MNSTAQQAKAVLAILEKTYPDAHIALNYSTPWELLVAVILSAQCTDVRVNLVTPGLFKKYPTVEDVAKADLPEFEQVVKSTGFYHAKAKNILAAARLVVEKFHGQVPKTMEEILTLPGVARKTANVVLGNAYGVVEGIAVDTHVIRLSQRLRLVDLDTIGGKKAIYFRKSNAPRPPLKVRGGEEELLVDFKKDADPVKIEKELMAVLPREKWFTTTYRLVDHGRAICKALKPDCPHCPLNKVCPASRV